MHTKKWKSTIWARKAETNYSIKPTQTIIYTKGKGGHWCLSTLLSKKIKATKILFTHWWNMRFKSVFHLSLNYVHCLTTIWSLKWLNFELLMRCHVYFCTQINCWLEWIVQEEQIWSLGPWWPSIPPSLLLSGANGEFRWIEGTMLI